MYNLVNGIIGNVLVIMDLNIDLHKKSLKIKVIKHL